MSTDTSRQTPSWLKAARSRSRLAHLWQVPTFLLGLAALVVVCGGAVERHGRQCQDYQDRLAALRHELHEGQTAAEELLPVAEALVDEAGYYHDQAGEAHFLLGSVLQTLADGQPGDAGQPTHQRALFHFQQAESIGVTLRDRLPLWYRLGKALYRSESNTQQAIDYLVRGLPKGADNPAEGYGLLAQAYLRLPTPDVDAALQANDLQIKLSNDEAILLPARLQRAELFVQKKQYYDALKVLERVGPDSPETLWRKSLYLQATCAVAEGLWTKAVPLWEELLDTPQAVPDGKKRILYALGKCYQLAVPPAESKAVGAWEMAVKEGGEEGQAAAIHLAELHLSATPANLDTAAQYLEQAFANIQSDKDYKNTLVPLDHVRELVDLGIHEALAAAAHEPARQLTQVYQRFSPPGTAEKKLAEISETFAKNLDDAAAQATGDKAETLKQKAREEWARAGAAYYQAAQVKAEEGLQSALLWQSIVCHRSAGQDEKAASLLKEYLARELPADDQARAWFTLGESFRALDRRSEAENAYQKCWEFSESPYSYRARYQLALDRIASKELDQAEAILWVNLKVQGPNLDREAHEKSLYLLARLLYQRGIYSQAILWLQEAADRYPDNPEAFAIRDLLGDSYNKQADDLQRKIEDGKNSLPVTAVSQLKNGRRDLLEKASHTYEQLADDLKLLRDTKALGPAQEKLFRKAAFTAAEIEFKLEEFTEALRRYEALAELGRGQFEELVAFYHIRKCCVALKFQPKELSHALDVLGRVLSSVEKTLPTIPDEMFTGPWSRKEWHNLLTTVRAELGQTAVEALRPPAS